MRSRAPVSAQGRRSPSFEESEEIPAALRAACRLAASPQLRNMATLGGNLLQSTRCWYWRLQYPCRLHGGDRCHAREGEHREHAIFANDFCASAHPSDLAAALLALEASVRTNRRELPLAELYRLPGAADTRLVTLEEGEVLLELELPPCDASVYLKAMDRKRFGFPLVGVAAVRRGETTRLAALQVAAFSTVGFSRARSTPRRRFRATPYKLRSIARALVTQALATIEAR